MPPLVFLSEPNDIRTVVTAPLDILHSGVGAAVTAPLFGSSSFMLLEEAERLNGREAIVPAFHRHAVVAHETIVAEIACREIAKWPTGSPTVLHPRLSHMTLSVMLATVFGDHPRIAELRDAMLSMLSVTASLVLQEPRLNKLPRWRGIWARFIRDKAMVDLIIAHIIADRRASPTTNDDMLAMLLSTKRLDGSPMTDVELRDNLVAVIIAGHETTASALAWALQLLAHHSEIQERLISEIDCGTEEVYLVATVNEVLRHRPVFLFAAPRAVVEPIEIGGWLYEPPAHLLGCIYLMHHDPALFPRPDEFLPERFLNSRATSRTWLPWGGGRQLCPGRHLALLELRTVLRILLSTARIVPVAPKIERARWRSVIVTPHAGSTVVLRRRRPMSTPTRTRPLGMVRSTGLY
jgi:hypothetical protein